MKIIILGAGQVGRTAAYHLSREEANDVTVIDLSEDVLRDLQDRLDIRTVTGNASSPRVLEAAGIGNTDILVALTNASACSARGASPSTSGSVRSNSSRNTSRG